MPNPKRKLILRQFDPIKPPLMLVRTEDTVPEFIRVDCGDTIDAYAVNFGSGVDQESDGTTVHTYDQLNPTQVVTCRAGDLAEVPPPPPSKLKAYTATIQIVVVSAEGPAWAADAISEMLRNCDRRYNANGDVLDWKYISDYGADDSFAPGGRQAFKPLDDFEVPDDPQLYEEGSVFAGGKLDPGIGSGTILVCVEGGIVQAVVSDTPERFKHLKVQIVDYDVEGVESDDEHLQAVQQADGRVETAYVQDFTVEEQSVKLLDQTEPGGDAAGA